MIAVVGGGVTGLAVGWELSSLGVDFVVLEAASRPGGVIRSAEVDGRILDWGPQRTRLTSAVRRLVDALGLAEEIVTARPGLDLFVYSDRCLRKVPFSAGAFLTSDVVSLAAKLRLMAEPLTRGADPDESVAAYFTRKLGAEVYESLVAPLYGGLYASDPKDMRVGLSLIRVLEEFKIDRSLLLPLLRRGGRIQPPPACTFRGGMQRLPDALAEAVGDRLLLRTAVRSIRPTGERWAVELDDATLTATHVILTTPAPVASALLKDAIPDVARAFGTLRYNPLGIVHLDAETGLEGLGFQVAFTEDHLTLRGVTFNNSLFGRRNLYTAYLGGARHPEVAEMTEAELGALAVREFELCTGYSSRVLSAEHERMPAWDVTWAAIQELALPPGLRIATNWWSRPGIPGRLAEAAQVARAVTGSLVTREVT